MSPKTTIASIILLIILLLPNAQCKEFSIGLPIQIVEKDPYDLELLEESEVYSSIFDSLLSYDPITGYTPTLADKWLFNESKGTISFSIKKGLKYSDGSQLESTDVAFTLQRAIALDKEKSLALTKCLSMDIEYNNPSYPHPRIVVLNNTELVLGPTKCKTAILSELNDPNFGIISRKYVDKDFKFIPGSPTSGAFRLIKEKEHFKLKPNYFNWRWTDKNSNPSFIFFKTDNTGSLFNTDAFRTSDQNQFDLATSKGYSNLTSVPIMTWFLSADPTKITQSNLLFNQIYQSEYLKNLDYFQKNRLEYFADSFFPPEFNCNHSKKKPKKIDISKDTKINLINHPSGESIELTKAIGSLLSKLGYRFTIDSSATTNDKDVLNIKLRRQFLGDSKIGSLNFAFRVVNTIPDPDKKMTNLLSNLDKSEVSLKNQRIIEAKVCESLHLYNHLPIAHRNFGYLYKDSALKDLFSKGNGNLNYNLFAR